MDQQGCEHWEELWGRFWGGQEDQEMHRVVQGKHSYIVYDDMMYIRAADGLQGDGADLQVPAGGQQGPSEV